MKINQITQHHQPKHRLQNLLNFSRFKNLTNLDAVTLDLINLCEFFQNSGINLDHLGVTGSLLIAAQNHNSDIDLVFYQRDREGD